MYYHKIKMTDEEIIEMYMTKCTHLEVSKMLLQSNKMLTHYTGKVRVSNAMDVQSTRDTNVKVELESTFTKRDYFWGGFVIGLVFCGIIISIINLIP